MSDLPALPLSIPTAARMGYPNLIAAVSIEHGATITEFGILPPGTPLSMDRWAVIIHRDTDPDEPTAGTSSIGACDTVEDAIEQLKEELKTGNALELGYIVAGMSTTGKRVYVAIDTYASGWSYITDHDASAAWYPTAESAKRALAAVPKIVGQIKIAPETFAIMPTVIKTRNVDLSGGNGNAPAGWAFVIADEMGAQYLAPDRYWTRKVGVGDARRFYSSDTAEASRTEDGQQIILVSLREDGQPLSSERLDALVNAEMYALTSDNLFVELEAGSSYKPR